jgi:hypothetical protein
VLVAAASEGCVERRTVVAYTCSSATRLMTSMHGFREVLIAEIVERVA